MYDYWAKHCTKTGVATNPSQAFVLLPNDNGIGERPCSEGMVWLASRRDQRAIAARDEVSIPLTLSSQRQLGSSPSQTAIVFYPCQRVGLKA